MVVTKDYKGSVALFFENGKAVLIPMSCYETKTNRKKLTNAYSNDSKAVGIFFVPEIKTRSDHKDFFLKSDGGKGMIVSSSVLTSKVTRTSNGVICFTIKKGQKIISAVEFTDDGSEERKEIFSRYRKTKVPSTGTTITNGKQLSFLN
jgi:DNA gyrase subunit A